MIHHKGAVSVESSFQIRTGGQIAVLMREVGDRSVATDRIEFYRHTTPGVSAEKP
jgi:hypothetical protein